MNIQFEEKIICRFCLFLAVSLLPQLTGLSLLEGQGFESPQMRMRPITEGSPVDRYRSDRRSDYRLIEPSVTSLAMEDEVGPSSPVGVVAQAQFQFPAAESDNLAEPQDPGGFDTSSAGSSLGQAPEPFSQPPSSSPLPSTSLTGPSSGNLPLKRELPRGFEAPGSPNSGVTAGSQDYAPFSPPQLGDQFATMDNSTFVSPPSGYVATTSWGVNCLPQTGYASTNTMSQTATTGVGQGVRVSNGLVPFSNPSQLQLHRGVPRGSWVSFGQSQRAVVVGEGILGQPVAYIPGQTVRNWVRYIFP